MIDRHLIHTNTLDIAYSNADKARALQSKISAVFHQKVARIYQEVLDEFDIPSKHLVIPSITLDIGSLIEDELEVDFPERIRLVLSEQLHHYFEKRGISSSVTKEIYESSEKQSYTEGLHLFLQSGTLPYWAMKQSIGIGKMIDTVIHSYRSEWIRLLKKSGKQWSYIQRVVFHFSELQLQRVVEELEPAQANVIIATAEELSSVQEKKKIVELPRHQYKQKVWELILHYLLNDRGTYFNTKSFVKSVLQGIAGHLNLNFLDFLHDVRIGIEALETTYSFQYELPKLLLEIHEETLVGEEGKHEEEYPTSEQDEQNALQRFLLTGSFMAPYSGWSKKQLWAVWDATIGDPNRAVIQWIVQKSRNEQVRKRVVAFLDEARIKSLIVKVVPGQGEMILNFADELEHQKKADRWLTSVGDSHFNSIKWELILKVLFTDRGTLYNTLAFLRQTIKMLAGQYNLTFVELLNAIVQSVYVKEASLLTGTMIQALRLLQEEELEQVDAEQVKYQLEELIGSSVWTSEKEEYISLLLDKWCSIRAIEELIDWLTGLSVPVELKEKMFRLIQVNAKNERTKTIALYSESILDQAFLYCKKVLEREEITNNELQEFHDQVHLIYHSNDNDRIVQWEKYFELYASTKSIQQLYYAFDGVTIKESKRWRRLLNKKAKTTLDKHSKARDLTRFIQQWNTGIVPRLNGHENWFRLLRNVVKKGTKKEWEDITFLFERIEIPKGLRLSKEEVNTLMKLNSNFYSKKLLDRLLIPEEIERTIGTVGALHFVLTYGKLPWWQAHLNVDIDNINEWVKQLLSTEKVGLETPFLDLLKDKKARLQLIEKTESNVLFKWVKKAVPLHYEFVSDYFVLVDEVAKQGTRVSAEKQALNKDSWNSIFELLLIHRGSRFNTKSFLMQQLRHIATQINRTYFELFHIIHQVKSTVATSISSSTHSLLLELEVEAQKEERRLVHKQLETKKNRLQQIGSSIGTKYDSLIKSLQGGEPNGSSSSKDGDFEALFLRFTLDDKNVLIQLVEAVEWSVKAWERIVQSFSEESLQKVARKLSSNAIEYDSYRKDFEKLIRSIDPVYITKALRVFDQFSIVYTLHFRRFDKHEWFSIVLNAWLEQVNEKEKWGRAIADRVQNSSIQWNSTLVMSVNKWAKKSTNLQVVSAWESIELLKEKRKEEAEKTISESKEVDRTGSKLEMKEEEILSEYFVNNAGLVLIWPFFERLFSMLGWLNGKEFSSSENAERAVCLLQYIVTGEEVIFEPDVVLNKLLTGVPLEHPMVSAITLTEQEKEVGESLLGGVIANWTILGTTSPQGLRETFLKREAILKRKEGRFELYVENKQFDMLIDKIPWSYTYVKLAWMEEPIQVIWR